ncbi:SDR family oxidoreductase [Candidatus Magnetominusculus dajiuhuensis]|uniref:SDR family oxidoreductase n=1 Tax=Candidatus Magnetominusculus dajiuhuensis TaxID=3137712 RepID=UPI003B43C399
MTIGSGAVSGVHVVTGAFGFSGKYIAQSLLNTGVKVKTITNSPNRPDPFGGVVEVFPFNFDKPGLLIDTLGGTDVLYNTYWVRFNHKLFKHADAVENTLTLFDAAKKAGVKRIVHVSITNPKEDSHLEYFSGKARLERALIDSGMSYAIVRPTVLFGKEDILINNIAWSLRTFPVFGIFGDGSYRLQPIYVKDLAELAVDVGKIKDNIIIDAIGPDTFTFRELVSTIGEIIGKRRPIVTISDDLGYYFGKIMQHITGDILITREEIDGLKSNLLYVRSQPTGQTSLTQWLKEHASTVGVRYASELGRRVKRTGSYK